MAASPVVVSGGILAFGVNNALGANKNIAMTGGSLEVGAYTNALGALTLNGNATIVLGEGELSFTNSSAVAWTGTLNLTNELGSTTLRFGTSHTALTFGQMESIKWQGKAVTLNDFGYVTLKRGTLLILK